MFTLKIKLVALLVTSANILMLPLSLPEFELSIKPSNSSHSLPSAINSLLNSADQCTPDVALLFNRNITDDLKSFESCAKHVLELKNKTHPDAAKTTGEIIQSYGYPLEIHKVKTKDGYILTLHRIPRHGRTPVYLQHGLGGW